MYTFVYCVLLLIVMAYYISDQMNTPVSINYGTCCPTVLSMNGCSSSSRIPDLASVDIVVT